MTQSSTGFGGGSPSEPQWSVQYNKDGSFTSNDVFLGYDDGKVVFKFFELDKHSVQNVISIGENTLTNASIGVNNIGIGKDVMTNYVTGEYNIGIGNNIMASPAPEGSENIGIGAYQMESLTDGSGNIALGYLTLRNVTSGYNNISLGGSSNENITTGFNNVSVGVRSGRGVTTGRANISIGYQTINLGSADGTFNFRVAVGDQALENGGGQGDTAIGNQSMQFSPSTSGGNNTSVGHLSGLRIAGNHNTAIGYSSYNNLGMTAGDYNTIIGASSGGGILTGDNNTIIGARVTGLDPALTDNVILSDGNGNVSYRDDASKTTITKPLSSKEPVRTESANYTIDPFQDKIILVDTAAVVITLPTAVGNEGKKFCIKNFGAGANITLNPDGAELIDNLATIPIADTDWVWVVSNGANWAIV